MRLSIQISLNGFSFCTINSQSKNIEEISHQLFSTKGTPESTLQHLAKAFETNSLLQLNFDSIEVIYENDLYTFVPTVLFDKKKEKEYLKYNIKTLATDYITHDSLEQHELTNVYIPYANINNYIFERFGSFEYYHIATVLVERLLKKEKNSESTKIFAYLTATNFYIIVIKNGKLLLCNTFIYQSKEDFLYYLMFTAEQLHLNPEEFSLVLLGAIDIDNDCYKIAYQYIRNIEFISPDPSEMSTIQSISKPYHKEFIFLNRL